MDAGTPYRNITVPVAPKTGCNSMIIRFWLLMSQLIGLAASVSIICWVMFHGGGLAWDEDPAKEFNWHPISMVVGLIYLNGSALVVYRAFPTYPKRTLKIVHAVLQAGSFIFSVVALKAVFDSHNLQGFPNLYSLHSWIGIITVIVFGAQLLMGVALFLLPMSPLSLRACYKPLHIWAGMAVLTAAVASVVSGITEKSFNKIEKGSESYLLLNFVGLAVLVFASIVQYILINPAFRRPAEQETEE